MDEDYNNCTWQEFEGIIRSMINSDFKWIIKLDDNPMNRKVIIEIIKTAIELNLGKFPDKNVLIERVQDIS